MSPAPRVRAARRADLPAVVALAAEHAAYERAPAPAPDLARRLAALLFDTPDPGSRAWSRSPPGARSSATRRAPRSSPPGRAGSS